MVITLKYFHDEIITFYRFSTASAMARLMALLKTAAEALQAKYSQMRGLLSPRFQGWTSLAETSDRLIPSEWRWA
jgi:hypothetical protein